MGVAAAAAAFLAAAAAGGGGWKGTTAHLAWLSFWPEASPKRWREERREWTVAGVQAASSAVVSSAYCTARTRSPPTAMPRSGLERSQHERAQPTKRYMAGARGQPCLLQLKQVVLNNPATQTSCFKQTSNSNKLF